MYIYIYKAIISKTHVSPELSENKKNAHDPLGGHPFIATEVHKLFNFKCPASGWNRRSNQRERLDLLKRKKTLKTWLVGGFKVSTHLKNMNIKSCNPKLGMFSFKKKSLSWNHRKLEDAAFFFLSQGLTGSYYVTESWPSGEDSQSWNIWPKWNTISPT